MPEFTYREPLQMLRLFHTRRRYILRQILRARHAINRCFKPCHERFTAAHEARVLFKVTDIHIAHDHARRKCYDYSYISCHFMITLLAQDARGIVTTYRSLHARAQLRAAIAAEYYIKAHAEARHEAAFASIGDTAYFTLIELSMIILCTHDRPPI